MAKAIREFCGKELLHKYVEKLRSEAEGERQGKLRIPFVSAPVTESTDFDLLVKGNPWLTSEVQVYVWRKEGGVFVYTPHSRQGIGINHMSFPSPNRSWW